MKSYYRIIPVLFVTTTLIAFSIRQLSDPDVGFHLRYGKWIVENKTAPTVDISTYTSAGNQYTDLQWLFQAMVYGVYKSGGYAGISVIICIFALTLFGLMVLRNRSSGIPSLLSAILLLAFVLLFEQRIAPRPEMVSYTLLTIVFIILDGYSSGKTKLLPILPIIMLIWCNVHSLFMLGIVSMVIAWLANWITTHKADKKFAGWILLSVLSCLITPYGWHGFVFPFFLLTRFDPQNIYNRHILEFTPFFSQTVFYTRDYLFLLMALGTFVSVILFFRRLPLFQVLTALIFLPLGLLSVRNTPLFAIAAVPLIGQSLTFLVNQWKTHHKIVSTILIPAMILLSIYLTISVISNKWYSTNNSIHRTGLGLNADQLPIKASKFIAERHLDGRIMNSLGYGGWFSWTLPQPVFIDGRLEVMPATLYRQVVDSWKGGLPELIRNYGPVIIAYNYLRYYPWTIQLRDMPAWRLVYADGQSAVFLHNSYRREIEGAPASVASEKNERTDSLHIAMLFNQLGLHPARADDHSKAIGFFNQANDHYHRGDITGAKILYDSAINLDPSYIKALNNRAILKASGLHDLKGALEDFGKAIGLNPAASEAYLGRGTVFMLLNDTTSACFDWHKAASLGNDRAMRLVRMHCDRK